MTVGPHTHPSCPGTLAKHGDGVGCGQVHPQRPAPHLASYPQWLCGSSASAWPSTGWAAVLFQGEALGVAGSRVGEEGRTFKTNVNFLHPNILIIKQS